MSISEGSVSKVSKNQTVLEISENEEDIARAQEYFLSWLISRNQQEKYSKYWIIVQMVITILMMIQIIVETILDPEPSSVSPIWEYYGIMIWITLIDILVESWRFYHYCGIQENKLTFVYTPIPVKDNICVMDFITLFVHNSCKQTRDMDVTLFYKIIQELHDSVGLADYCYRIIDYPVFSGFCACGLNLKWYGKKQSMVLPIILMIIQLFFLCWRILRFQFDAVQTIVGMVVTSILLVSMVIIVVVCCQTIRDWWSNNSAGCCNGGNFGWKW